MKVGFLSERVEKLFEKATETFLTESYQRTYENTASMYKAGLFLLLHSSFVQVCTIKLKLKSFYFSLFEGSNYNWVQGRAVRTEGFGKCEFNL